MSPKQRRALLIQKVPKRIYPIAIEHSYAVSIQNDMKAITVKILSRIEGRLPTWIRLSDSIAVLHDGARRFDALDDELEQLLVEIEKEIALLFAVGYDIGLVIDYVASVAERVFAFEKGMWGKQVSVVLGTPLGTANSWWPAAKRLWVNENHRLIKSLAQEYVTKLNTTLLTGFQSGWTFEEMVDGIQKLSDSITGYRARLIARDQVGKLQYAITRSQFEEIGVDGYLWTSARDERVRGNPRGIYRRAVPSHWEIDGKLCKLSDPTVYSEDGGRTWVPRTRLMPEVHPGQAILCRCVCTPYWLPLIQNEAIL
jgi:hypothetical protein